MFESFVKPKRPVMEGWVQVENMAAALNAVGYPYTSWLHRPTGLFAISAVEVTTPEPGEPDLGPQYHLSMSLNGQRCTSEDALFVLNAFEMRDAKEDNHVPSGRVRNWWRPVADHLSGYECPCVDVEPKVVEDKGDFVWRGLTK